MNGQLFGALLGEEEMARLSRLCLTRIFGLVLVIALFSAMSGRIAWSQEQPGLAELRAFNARASEWAATVNAIGKTMKALGISCDQAKLVPADYLSIAKPVTFKDGVPVAGAWVQRVSANGCGTSKFQNVTSVVVDGQVEKYPSLPGTTEISFTTFLSEVGWITNRAVIAYNALKGKNRSQCAIRDIGETEFLEILKPATADANPPGSNRRWRELWTVISRCGDTIFVPINFAPDLQSLEATLHFEDFIRLNNF